MNNIVGSVIDIDPSKLKVIVNRGSEHGVYDGQRVVVFALGKELIDPDTQENLGRLEVLRGRGQVIHTQEKFCTVRSTETRRIFKEHLRKKAPSMLDTFRGSFEPFEYVTEPIEDEAPFDNVTLGDTVRFL